MIFVGNRGCVQIFTGVVEKLTPMKGWLNIFNPTFTLHLLEETIAETWVTRKPTADGHVTSTGCCCGWHSDRPALRAAYRRRA